MTNRGIYHPELSFIVGDDHRMFLMNSPGMGKVPWIHEQSDLPEDLPGVGCLFFAYNASIRAVTDCWFRVYGSSGF